MHFCVIKSRTIKIITIILLVAVLLAISINGSTSAQVFFGYAPRKVPIYSVATEEKRVAISFDAAWGADKTEEILKILDEFDVTATFFLVGFWVDDYTEMVEKIDQYNDFLANLENFETIFINIGDGLAITIRNK